MTKCGIMYNGKAITKEFAKMSKIEKEIYQQEQEALYDFHHDY